ncbi:glycosyltransferase family 4 protein [Sedimentimonas flavescens]|uniref:Glycosyltransferase family 4 protein n=2 Tax=Sedimentimonas flavescens TaxID=2851012 RepID=A0ABT2ZVA4_9RHOB|nr:glycosyltransferase family 4 protein [Sedimentimonas flavescens]
MHILLSANSAWNIWNFRRPVVQELIARKHRVSVLAPPDDSLAELEAMGCRTLPLEMSVKGLNPVEDLRLLYRFKRQFREERPDVVLGYTIKNNLFGALAAKRLGIPFIPNVTGLGTAFLSGGALRFVAEQLYRRAFADLRTVFFQNPDDRKLFVSRQLVTAEQARLLPGSGIDLRRFAAVGLPDPETPPVFLMIARLLRDKGVMEFVQAARLVKATHPGTRFQLLGACDAENRSAIDKEMVDAWVAEGLIEYLGTTEDVRPNIARATCVVLPSYREGAPRTLIEAAAMARPLIATDVPGCREVVDHGITGYLCKLRSADSLARAMLTLLSRPPEALTAMGRAGRRKVEQVFDEQIVVDAYMRAIDELTRGFETRLERLH